MSSLLHVPQSVYSTPALPALRIADLLDVEPEPFHPSARDLAWDMGYTLGREGVSAWPAFDLAEDARQSFSNGNRAGRTAFEAYQAGRDAGLVESEAVEAPPRFSRVEARAAYCLGYSEGLAECLAATEAWIAEREAERLEDHFGPAGLSDRDVYPVGCMS